MSEILDNNAVSELFTISRTSPGDNAGGSDETGTVETPAEPSPDFPTITERGELQIIIVSPDGSMTIYDEGGNITAEVADTAYSLWLSENAALDKKFDNYSVSEALLLFIALGSLVGLISKVFKRRIKL